VVDIVTVPEAEVITPDPNSTPPLDSVIVPVGPVCTAAVITTEWPYMLEPEVVTVTEGFNFATT
jgi:hypothetical protein